MGILASRGGKNMLDDLSIDKTLGGGAGAGGAGWSLSEGDTLGGYRVVKPLGKGGMGEVYLVENALTRKQYALKLLPSELARDRGFQDRFAREAAVLQEFRHEGIVQVHHAAEEGGHYFLTMDYVDGGSLDDRLRGGKRDRGTRTDSASGTESEHAPPGRLPEEEVARIGMELCDALGYAHRKGIVHRDIKPANVLLDSDGRAKLSDFGLARVVGDDFLKSMTERSISLSMARTDGGGLSQSDNAVIGTYEYMSPEQKAGTPADERSDIFSMGLMFYRMLTGKKAEGRFPDPSKLGCDGAWDSIVDRALAPEPEDRYASVGDLGADVREAGEAVTAEAKEEREQADVGDTLRAAPHKVVTHSPPPREGQSTIDTRKVSPDRQQASPRRVPTPGTNRGCQLVAAGAVAAIVIGTVVAFSLGGRKKAEPGDVRLQDDTQVPDRPGGETNAVRALPSHTRSYDQPDSLRVGLVGHWTFDEGKGDVARDSSGRGGSATLVHGGFTKGRLGSSLSLSGNGKGMLRTLHHLT